MAKLWRKLKWLVFFWDTVYIKWVVIHNAYCGTQGRCWGLKVVPSYFWEATSYLLIQILLL